LLGQLGDTDDVYRIIDVTRALPISAQQDHDPRETVRLTERCLQVDPKPSWFFWLVHLNGLARFRAGDCQGAIRVLNDALQLPGWKPPGFSSPVIAMAHYQLGRVPEARRELELARRLLDQWNQQMSQSAVGITPIGWWDVLEFQGLYKEATLLIEGRSPPDDPRLHIVRAHAFSALGHDDKEAREFEQAETLGRDNPDIQVHLFWYHANRGRREQAESALARAVALRPDDAAIRLNLFRFYLNGSDWPKAEAELARLVKERPKDAAVHLEAGQMCFAAKKWDKAVTEFNLAQTIEPDKFTAWRQRADAYFNLGIYGKAWPDYEKAIESAPDDGWLWYILYGARGSAGSQAEALGFYDHAVQRWPANALARFWRGAHYQQVFNDDERALKDYSKAIALSPATAQPYWIYMNRGSIYANQHKWEQAIADWSRAIEMKPDNERLAQLYRSRCRLFPYAWQVRKRPRLILLER
jgi:tetratricopeptide (TPR) repeat protein